MKRLGFVVLAAVGCTFDPVSNLEANGTFDDGCQGWGAINSRLSPFSPGRNGNACEVCAVAAADYTMDDQPNPVMDARIGQIYEAQAWVRRSPNGTALKPVAIRIREWQTPDQVEGDTTPGNFVDLTNDWTATRVRHVVIANAPALDIYVGGTGGGECFLVDDLVLYRVD
jgi:hypothetical protein